MQFWNAFRVPRTQTITPCNLNRLAPDQHETATTTPATAEVPSCLLFWALQTRLQLTRPFEHSWKLNCVRCACVEFKFLCHGSWPPQGKYACLASLHVIYERIATIGRRGNGQNCCFVVNKHKQCRNKWKSFSFIFFWKSERKRFLFIPFLFIFVKIVGPFLANRLLFQTIRSDALGKANWTHRKWINSHSAVHACYSTDMIYFHSFHFGSKLKYIDNFNWNDAAHLNTDCSIEKTATFHHVQKGSGVIVLAHK